MRKVNNRVIGTTSSGNKVWLYPNNQLCSGYSKQDHEEAKLIARKHNEDSSVEYDVERVMYHSTKAAASSENHASVE